MAADYAYIPQALAIMLLVIGYPIYDASIYHFSRHRRSLRRHAKHSSASAPTRVSLPAMARLQTVPDQLLRARG
jgi:hypothetical protein